MLFRSRNYQHNSSHRRNYLYLQGHVHKLERRLLLLGRCTCHLGRYRKYSYLDSDIFPEQVSSFSYTRRCQVYELDNLLGICLLLACKLSLSLHQSRRDLDNLGHTPRCSGGSCSNQPKHLDMMGRISLMNECTCLTLDRMFCKHSNP